MYQLTLMQDSKLTKTTLAIDSYDIILANIGGYFGLVYGMFSFLTLAQKRFTLDMHLA